MNTDQTFQKLKSTLHTSADDLLIVGKLHRNTPSNPNCGFISAFFQIENGIVEPITSDLLMTGQGDLTPSIFVRSGYEQLEKDYGSSIFICRAEAIPNPDRSCKYWLAYSAGNSKNHSKLTKEMGFIAEISNDYIDVVELENSPFQHKIESYEKLYFDTPFIFELDSDKTKLVGPLYQNANSDEMFHGPGNRMSYPFWNGKKREEFKSFVIDIADYQRCIATIKTEDGERKFLINLELLSLNEAGKIRNEAFKSIDLAPYNVVLNEFYKLADKSNSIKAYPKSKVKEWLENKSIKLTEERKLLVESLLLNYSYELDNKEEIFKSILNSDNAVTLLKQIAEENEDKYLSKYRDQKNIELEKLNIEFEQQKREIAQQNSAIKEEITKSKKELQLKYDERKTLLDEIENKIKVELENVQNSEKYKSLLAQKNQELTVLNNQIKEATDKYGNFDDIEKISSIKNDLNEEISNLSAVQEHYRATLSKIKDDINAEIPILAHKYLNQQIISDIQNFDFYKYNENRTSESEEVQKISAVKTATDFQLDDLQLNRSSVIEKVANRLQKMNRTVDKFFVESSLVAIMQSQYAVFMGLPGTGKTSFATQLTLALGSNDSTLLVPVAKEWTRPKDLIGYYNSLTKSFETGTTKFKPFYDRLNQLENNELPPSFLILDEFNLSQPEYYLSSLTGLADLGSSRDIEVGANKHITIPESNRFICTANTDDTVQGLTPRMISRCVFIKFDDLPELSETQDDLIFSTKFSPFISGKDLVDLFNVDETDVLSDHLQEAINHLISILRLVDFSLGNTVSITPRKYNQLIRFCKVMNSQEYGSDKILDVACQYYLLPIICGSGERFKQRLLKLKSASEDLSLEKFTNDIDCLIQSGESNFDYFQFIMG
ncbi:hypothetical protein [Paraglaciecola sp.]|uniref:hypothetical protein n=1 Tax=Paraglaciecola sp. TaxID=1920173 RepID=UPI0032647B8E